MHFKTSTLCAASSLVVLAGFMAVNLAGCGGGGGGGGIASPTATPVSVSVSFTIANLPAATDNGTIVLTSVGGTAAGGVTKSFGTAGKATFIGVQPGFYDLIVTVKNKAGGTIQSYTVRSYQIVGTASNYVISNTSSALKVSGTLFSNPNNSNTVSCGASAVFITGRVRILVRDLDASKGNPIISQAVRNGLDDGTYTISVPYRPTTFIVELDRADINAAPYAGKSALTTFTSDVTEVTDVDVCGNSNGIVPVPNPTPTLTPTTFATATPTGTLTPTAIPTATPTATTAPTATPTATTAP